MELAKEVMWRLGLTLPEVKSLFVVTEHISHELHLSLTYSLAWFCGCEMLMSLFFLSGTKKIYSSNLKEYGNVTEMETTLLVFNYDVIELGLGAEFQDLLWLRQSFDAGCIAVEQSK